MGFHSSPAGTDGLSSGGDDHRLDGGQEPAREGGLGEGGREEKDSLKEPSDAGERL